MMPPDNLGGGTVRAICCDSNAMATGTRSNKMMMERRDNTATPLKKQAG